MGPSRGHGQARRRIVRPVRVAICLLLVAACGKGDKKAPPDDPGGSGSSTAAGSVDKLDVSIDGKPVAMKRAFIKRVSPDQWRLHVSDDEGSCEELLSGVTNRKPGATTFVATIGKRIKADGTEVTTVLDLWSGGHLSDAVLASATIEGSSDKGGTVEIELGKMIDATKQRKLEIKGTLTAVGCGDQALPTVGLPKASHPSTAKLTVAGKQVPLVGAIRRGDDITLSTGPRDCTPPTVAAQAILEHAPTGWTMSGTWFDQPQGGTEVPELKVAPGSTGSSVDGATVTLALSGSGKIAEYPISLDGSIEAIDCPK